MDHVEQPTIQPGQRVTVVNFDMEFWTLVAFLVKCFFASLVAAIVVALPIAFLFVLFARA